MSNKVKKILLITVYSILCIVDLYLIYASIGFGVMGSRCPAIIGEEKAVFMGNYILTITFGVIALLVTAGLVVWGILYLMKKKKGNA